MELPLTILKWRAGAFAVAAMTSKRSPFGIDEQYRSKVHAIAGSISL
jgi:hypothetical protein